jgi:hypothetical protein
MYLLPVIMQAPNPKTKSQRLSQVSVRFCIFPYSNSYAVLDK